jgi:hypothetical protein
MKQNKSRIFGCCLLTALMGAIGGGIIVAIAALVLPKIISTLMHQMRRCMQECDFGNGSETHEEMLETSSPDPQQD